MARRRAASDSEEDAADEVLEDLLTNDSDTTDYGTEESEDELDTDREHADEEDIARIIKEVEEKYQLTPEEDRLGRHAVTKVRSCDVLPWPDDACDDH